MKALDTHTADAARNILNPAYGLELESPEPELNGLEISFSEVAEQSELKLTSPWRNPTQLERPCFLLNFPFSYSTQEANNCWMTELSE
ncbi:hypothetical protein ACFW0H_12950 [Pseudomonas sp. CR3202]|uniref:hypothetical protein n=1 Tax=Pseudomonas sp. CR3202 TaxID=3351532 RepID=UPI003BF42F8B